MSGVRPEDSGLASGMVNTSFMMGGSLGLAVLAGVAASRTEASAASGTAHVLARNEGYRAAFLAGVVFAGLAAPGAGALLRTGGELSGPPSGASMP